MSTIIEGEVVSSADGSTSSGGGFLSDLVTAAGSVASAALTKPAVTNYTTNTITPESKSGINTGLYIGIGVVVVLIVVVLIIVLKKKK